MKLTTLVKPLLVTGLLLSGPVIAAPTAQQVLAASPVDDIVEQYPEMMSQGIRDGLKRSEQVPPMVADTIGYVVSSSFRAADIEKEIVKNLEQNLSEKQFEAVQGWYNTPVAQKISAREIAASDPANWKQIQAEAPELKKRYKGTSRADMFERFDHASRATDSAVDTTIAVQLGLATAMAAFSSDSVHYEELKQRIEGQRGTIRALVEPQVYGGYLHTYEPISTQEMGLYLDFLESGPGVAFSKTVTRSIQKAVTDPIESIGNQLVRFLAPQE